MKRPGLFTYAIGNPVSCLGFVILAGLTSYRWFNAEVEPNILMLVVPIIVAWRSLQAAQRLRDYKTWKRNWDALGGEEPAPRRSWFTPVSQGWSIFWTFAWWAPLGWWLSTESAIAEDMRRTLLWVFWVVAVAIGLGVGNWLLKKKAAWAARRPARTEDGPVVTVALSKPWGSPTPLQALEAVPGYAHQLVERSRGAHR